MIKAFSYLKEAWIVHKEYKMVKWKLLKSTWKLSSLPSLEGSNNIVVVSFQLTLELVPV